MEKNFFSKWGGMPIWIRKTLRIMKLFVVFLLVGMMHVSAAVNAQSELTVSFRNANLKEIFKLIEQRTEYSIFYKADIVESVKGLSGNFKRANVKAVLNEVLAGEDLTYRIDNKVIVILPGHATKAASQDKKRITGKVVDKNGEPMPGVTVVIKGTTTGVVTSLDGIYTLVLPENAEVVSFSFVGMKSQEVKIDNQTKIDITLEEDAIGLEEVVAIGYGVAKKSDLTGAVVNVKAEELNKFKPESVSELLRAAAPGLNVSYSTNAKSTPEFEIRGDNSLSAGNKPLIVVDGVIFNGSLQDLNVNDIETVDILKDASSAAIYGSRATNGVVVFTTKKGKKGNARINAKAKFALVTQSEYAESFGIPEVFDWKEDILIALNNKYDGTEAFTEYTDPRKLSEQDLTTWLDGTPKDEMLTTWLGRLGFNNKEIDNYINGRHYDWKDWLFHVGKRQSYDINLSGQNKTVNYYWSLGYKDNESVRVGDKYSTINSRIKLDATVADFLNIGVNAIFTYQDESGIPLSTGQYHNLSPLDTPWDADGNLELAAAGSNRSNPLLDPNYTEKKLDYYKFIPTVFARLNLPYGFTFTSNFSQRMVFKRDFLFKSPENPNWKAKGGEAHRKHSQTYEWQTDNILNWNKEFDKHRFDFTAVWNAERKQSWYTNSNTSQMSPTAKLGYHELKFGTSPGADSDDKASARNAWMTRMNYSFDKKYNLSASFRRDGSSRFGEDHTHANFYSISGGWTITEEMFLKDKIDWLNYFKLRASYGTNGNSSIGEYDSKAVLADKKYLNATWDGEYFTVPYMYVERMENPSLRWETAKAFNFGMDFSIFDSVLRGTVELYQTKTTDLLLKKKLPIITGFGDIMQNVGHVENSGVEISLNSVNLDRGDWRWTTSLNLSYNKNKITSLTGVKVAKTDAEGNPVLDDNGNPIMYEPDDINNGWFIGRDKSVIYDYNVLGIWQEGEEEEAAKYDQQPGDFRLQDVDGDGDLDTDDKQFLGYTTPRWRMSMINNIQFKDFELGFVIMGKFNYMGKFNDAKNNGQTYTKNSTTYKLPYWTPENPSNDYARILSHAPVGFNVYRKKSHVRLQNISLAYNVPAKWTKPIKLENVKVGLNVENVTAIAPDWDFGDPEHKYDLPRIFSFSVDFSF
ncbi:SusC/RagA family TonB-linked outer membrane protein [Prolixibacteraceae bacterium JC049]|nr:SusC/RagA family TonB-linked outer membrane protein [Prolixibacteraceae bacterium JC049]